MTLIIRRVKLLRWDGEGFGAPRDGVGKPVESLQIPIEDGGGAASSPDGGFHWGPSVSRNIGHECWVMLMGKVVEYSSEYIIEFEKNVVLWE
ncbi:MAG: hypothetical protein V1903_04715 [Bacteroidota bacterium]